MLTEKNEGVADLAGFLDGIGDFFHQCGFLFGGRPGGASMNTTGIFWVMTVGWMVSSANPD
jgi:hypothetical protein